MGRVCSCCALTKFPTVVQANLPPASSIGEEVLPLPLVVAALDCHEIPDGDLTTHGAETPLRVGALVDACEAALASRSLAARTFDLAVLGHRDTRDVAAALTLPPILSHSVDYAESVRAIITRAQAEAAGVAASDARSVDASLLSGPHSDMPDTIVSGLTGSAVAGKCKRAGPPLTLHPSALVHPLLSRPVSGECSNGGVHPPCSRGSRVGRAFCSDGAWAPPRPPCWSPGSAA